MPFSQGGKAVNELEKPKCLNKKNEIEDKENKNDMK